MNIGIVGLPNVGKSTLFKALTRKEVLIANYPFATIDPNVGVVEVPDARLQKLAQLSHSVKIIPAVVEFVDIAGLVKGAAEGEGLGNQFLSHIREVDAIAEVVRIFEDKDIIHVANTCNPVSDIEILEYELILKDLETIERRMHTVRADMKGQKKGAKEEYAALEKFETELKKGNLLSKTLRHDASDILFLRQIAHALCLLTSKPIIYICNVSESHIGDWQPDERLLRRIGDSSWVKISAKIEAELSDLSDEEQRAYLVTLGLEESGLAQLIRIAYETLGLMTFLTTGEKQTRAWTIRQGSTAPEAGRAIHSDFQEKFIRAEVIQWDKLLEAGSWANARARGVLRTEGKEYIVQDGDVMEFKV